MNFDFSFVPYFFVDHTVEHKDEEPLQGVQNGEEIGEGWRWLYDREYSNAPSDSEQEQKTKQTFHVNLEGGSFWFVNNERIVVVFVYLVDSNTQEVQVGSHYQEDRYQDGQH